MMRDTPAWLQSSDYPFESHYLHVGPGRLHYVDEGSGGSPLLMVHGQPTWSYMYRHVIGERSRHQRCIAVDLLGFGRSDKPRDWTYRPREHAENLGRLVDHLGLDRVDLLVHDWGGPIGLGWASANPERVGRIVALDTWMWSMAEYRAARIFSGVMGSRLGQWATERWNLFVNPFLKGALPDELWQRVAAAYTGPLAQPGDRRGCALFPKMLVDPWLDEIWQRRDVLRGKRAMLVWGGKDVAFPPATRERLETVFASCQVEVQPEVGHFVAEEMAEALPRLMEKFLDG